jgi:hypothetical protein
VNISLLKLSRDSINHLAEISPALQKTLDISNDLIDKYGTKITKKQHQDYDDLMAYADSLQTSKAQFWIDTSQMLLSETSKVSSGLADIMMGGKNKLKEIFKDIGKDFIKYFIQEALDALAKVFVVKMLKIIASIFDTRENDLMAAKQGADFAKYFTMGMENHFKANPLGQTIGRNINFAGAGMRGGGGMTIIISAQNFIGEENYIRNNIIPHIERAVNRGRSALVINRAVVDGRY